MNLDELDEMITVFARMLKQSGAPASIVHRATDMKGAIEWMKSKQSKSTR